MLGEKRAACVDASRAFDGERRRERTPRMRTGWSSGGEDELEALACSFADPTRSDDSLGDLAPASGASGRSLVRFGSTTRFHVGSSLVSEMGSSRSSIR